VRALLDVNVLVAGLLSRTGSPAVLLGKWLEGEFELVISDLLLEELQKTVARPKIRRCWRVTRSARSWSSSEAA
jgi:predicted nucleic acid-binding protein